MENESESKPEEVNNPAPPAAPEPQQVAGPVRPKRRKMVFFIVVGIVLALLLAGAAYWFLLKGDKQPVQPVANEQQQTGEAPTETPADPTPVKYKSNKLDIQLTHRKDWTLKETADELTVTSPSIAYTRVDGEATTGVFTLKIRKDVPESMQATIEKAVAPVASEVIAYLEPTKEQREYTNLSYAGQKDVFNFFIVTGSTEYKAGSTYAFTLAMDGEFYLIVGGYGADKDGTLSFDAVPKGSMNSTAFEQAIDIVESLKIF